MSFEVDPSLSQSTSRRSIVRTGAKLAYAVPLVAASMRLSTQTGGAQVSGPADLCARSTCAIGELCDDGRCFLAHPSCSGATGLAAGGGGISFCIAGVPDNPQSCSQTADCPAGQWCLSFDPITICVYGSNQV
jgi:hypothetical protein